MSERVYRIEIVEDDAMVRQVLRDMLKPEGFEVVACPDGASGLEAAGRDKPDLIVLDVNLPDLLGTEVCRRLKADPKTRHIPVLMLTGEAREVVQRVEGLDAGAEDYLFKPIGAKVFIARINSILKSSTRPV